MQGTQLRFGSFSDRWTPTTIGQILTIKHGKDYKHLPEGDIPVLGTGGKISGVTEALCNWPCVLIGRKGTINKPQYMDVPFWSVDTLFYSKAKDGQSPKFQYYLFQTIDWLKYNEASGVPSLSAATIEKISVNVPSVDEQQKIAAFFTALDEKIGLENKRLQLFRRRFHSVLFQVFHHRKYFYDENELLELIPLGQIATAVKKKNTMNECSLVLTNSAEHGVISQSDFFDRKIAQEQNLCKYTIVEKGDFVYNPRISKYAPAGPINRSDVDQGIVSPLYTVFRINEAKISCEYLKWYFESGEWVAYAQSVANYGARFDRMNISNQDFFDMPIPVPKKETQLQISSFLQILKKGIDLQDKKVKSLLKLKKAFMQQMFV